MEYTTLIATFYSIEPFMPAALAYSPNRIVLLVDSSDKEVRENIEKVQGTFGKVAKVEVVKVNSNDLYAIAHKTVAIIDMENKNTRIIVNISGGWRVIATGVLLGCFARHARLHEIVTNSFFYRIIIEEANEEVRKVLEDNFGNAYKNNDKHKPGKFSPVKVTDTNFGSVIGLENVKEELKRDIVYQIRHAELAKDFKVSMNGGMLLYGPPGNGKTMIVKAVAGETGANLIEVRIHDVLDMWVGNISKAVKKIFDRARKNTPCIVFIDEAEMLGSNRDSTEKQPWLREALGTLLTELDGISSQNEGVLVIGATNAPWMVDAALKRHGRLGKFLFVPMPKKEERIELFKLYLKGRPVSNGIDFEKISEIAGNCTASDIKTICDEAAKLAWVDSIDRGKKRGITMKDLAASIGKERFNAREWYDMAKQHITRDDKDLYKDFIESAASYEKDWQGDVAMYR